MQGLTQAYPAPVVFAPEAGRQRPGEDRPFATAVPWDAPPTRVPREESTLQVGLAGLSDLLHEGVREGAQVAPKVLAQHLGGNVDPRWGWPGSGCLRHIQVEMLDRHTQV